MLHSKYQRSNIKSFRGFSLIELLVASAIFITVSVIIISSLFVTFRLSRKTEVVRLLRQSGDSAMTQMVNQIRYAASLEDPVSCLGPSPTTQNFIVITSGTDYGITVLSCDASTISSNSASLVDTSRIVVANCSFSCMQSSPNHPPTVTIRYDLYPSSVADGAETQASTSFQSSVTMRNYSN
ncbi:MAG TPA: prepilin-type N-terminal cleavage/methylation domain-containing protein [Patescibacteria group bacterium]|nr:prepilin-type N-terminal cleavage/methylation domain-containing protein [Patescibacteria group bacterium]